MKEFEKWRSEIADFIFVSHPLERADIIFVPGNGYPQMAEKAAALYREGFAEKILPSGRFSITAGHFAGVLCKQDLYDKKYQTEWEFLSDVLIKNGVPEKAILKEDQATYTYENALFSRNVTDQVGLSVRKAILCCKNYHAGRAFGYFRKVFPEAEIMVCPVEVDTIRKDNWFLSEKGVAEISGEISRILMQFSLML